jgi:hypothetical protein
MKPRPEMQCSRVIVAAVDSITHHRLPVLAAMPTVSFRASGKKKVRSSNVSLLPSLEDIDAVFVTVEPHGGSQHPSGKQLLFAYLRVSPNHP